MTREEAIAMLKSKLDGHTDTSYEWCECVRMAIKALEQEPCPNCIEFKRYAKQMGFEIEQEPCEDCISREDTLKAMIEQLGIRNEDYLLPAEATLYKVVKNMPPVTPQPKTGHWTRELIRNDKGGCIGAKMICSNCGKDNKHDERMSYCPNCGAKMEREG